MDDLRAIKDQIEAMPAHELLYFAGGLLKRAESERDPRRKLKLARVAHKIADRVATELGAALALHDLEAARARQSSRGG
jgi:hypothetical protein